MGGSKKTFLKQEFKRLSSLLFSSISTLLKREREGPVRRGRWERFLPALCSWTQTPGAEIPKRDGALVCREPCQEVPPPSSTWPRPKDGPGRQSLPPPAFGSTRDVVGTRRIPPLSPAPLRKPRAVQRAGPLRAPLDSAWMGDAHGQAQGYGLCRGVCQTRGWARTSSGRGSAWLAAAPLCPGGPWAHLPPAPAEHNRDGTWRPPAPSASRASTRQQGWQTPSAPKPSTGPQRGPAARAAQRHPRPLSVCLRTLVPALPLHGPCVSSQCAGAWQLAPSPGQPPVPSP